mmetsp:Transcript_13602/g.23158  ORF Transcript_13602/g.23158 Transcript_13602/m.23158 type:complete len:130 (-) Transcript_13602:55-444(-)
MIPNWFQIHKCEGEDAMEFVVLLGAMLVNVLFSTPSVLCSRLKEDKIGQDAAPWVTQATNVSCRALSSRPFRGNVVMGHRGHGGVFLSVTGNVQQSRLNKIDRPWKNTKAQDQFLVNQAPSLGVSLHPM